MPWPKGKPRTYQSERVFHHSVRLSAEMSDAVYQIAKARGMSQYALLGYIVEGVLSRYRLRHGSTSCYGASQSQARSTVSDLLRGSSPSPDVSGR